MAVVEADNRQLLRHPHADVEQNIQQPIGDFIIIADHRGAAASQLGGVILQPAGSPLLHQGHPLIGVEPENALLLKGHLRVLQGVHHAGKPQNALPVVQLEDAADAGVPLLQQMLSRQISAAFVIVPDHRAG